MAQVNWQEQRSWMMEPISSKTADVKPTSDSTKANGSGPARLRRIQDDWRNAGDDSYNTEINPELADVNALALRLSKARSAMRAGAGLMSGAELQGDGTYLVSKGGKKNLLQILAGQVAVGQSGSER